MSWWEYSDEWDGDQEGLDSCDSTFDPEMLEAEIQDMADWAECSIVPGNPSFFFSVCIIRSLKEWQMIETPMTQDDLLDTALWIRRLP